MTPPDLPPKPKRTRRPTLASQAAQLWKAARAAGVNVALTVEEAGSKVTATPIGGDASAGAMNEWDADLGTNTPKIRQ